MEYKCEGKIKEIACEYQIETDTVSRNVKHHNTRKMKVLIQKALTKDLISCSILEFGPGVGPSLASSFGVIRSSAGTESPKTLQSAASCFSPPQ
mmetsp:Transcript_17028/g.25269  ORF Transcript_17028/g.25269 Transcript_17028/m.25269 type:complete len:94 (-) Transcript_17028:240-521(-)